MAAVDQSSPAAVTFYTTWPDADVAERCGRILLDRGLAACVNLLPAMRSIYRWRGEVETADEVVMLVKTTGARAAEARDAILAAHPYDTPCVLAYAANADLSAPQFVDWLHAETR